MIFVICGNIGAGKSTLIREIKKREPDCTVFLEPVEQWQYMLGQLYECQNADSHLLGLFQSLVFAHYMQVTAALMELEDREPQRKIYVERCPAEALRVFLPLNREKFTRDDYEALVHMHQRIVANRVWREAHYIILQAPIAVCLRRINRRARGGESHISEQYLSRLEQLQHDAFRPLLPCAEKVLVLDSSRRGPEGLYRALQIHRTF